MANNSRLWLLPLVVCATACILTKEPEFSRTNARRDSRKASCDIELRSTLPTGCEELGSFTAYYSNNFPSGTPAEYLEKVRSQACAVGATTLVTEVNSNGAVVRGTALSCAAAESGKHPPTEPTSVTP